MSEYTVKQGDCISSIAMKHGLTPDKIWDHPNNSKLKEKRKDQNILFIGDVVFIPDKDKKEESGGTEQRHRFRKKGVPAKLQIQLLDEEDEPRSNVEYVIDIDGDLYSSKTDDDGWIKRPIPPNAKIGKLILREDGEEEEYDLNLGHLNPIDQDIGVQQRLNNLGFDCGLEKGKLGSQTQEALKQFQKKYSLEKTGVPDDATRSKLEEVYGC